MLKARFLDQITPQDVPALRGATGRLMGEQGILFHHHTPTGYRYSYPLIQYKCIQQQPALICLGAGVQAIQTYLRKPSVAIEIGTKRLSMQIGQLDMFNHPLEVGDVLQTYRIHRWLALNQKNYAHYQSLTNRDEQQSLLERILTANLLSFARGINWQIEQRIKANVLSCKPRNVSYKKLKLKAFDVEFSTNVSLPYDIGLGGKVSLGFGTVGPTLSSEILTT